jgi:exosortase
VLLLLFLMPIPGSILDQLLLPLKELVSRIVDNVLHAAGYPIARSGVVLMIDTYSLLIADACSGLNSMLALSGIGLLYVHLLGPRPRWMKVALLMSILPIAFFANVIRVMLLVLVTYYQGDAAGRAFHDQAGLLEIGLAFGGFFLLDHLLERVNDHRRGAKGRRITAGHAL